MCRSDLTLDRTGIQLLVCPGVFRMPENAVDGALSQSGAGKAARSAGNRASVAATGSGANTNRDGIADCS
jgi:hypothetical protein